MSPTRLVAKRAREPRLFKGVEGHLSRQLIAVRLAQLADLTGRAGALAYSRISGLSDFEWRVLARVCETPPLSINELSGLLSRGVAQVSRAVKRLAAAGLLRRENVGGGPGVAISPTPLGKTVYAPMIGYAIEADAALIDGLGEEDLAALERCIAVMTENALTRLADEQALQDQDRDRASAPAKAVRKKQDGMASRMKMRLGAAALASLLLAAAAEPVMAQAPSRAEAMAAIAALPDWGGVWDLDFSSFGRQTQFELTPAYAARKKAFEEAKTAGENLQTGQANCLPSGMPGVMSQPYPIEFLFTPGKVTVAIEAFNQMRRIYLDGRAHPEDPDPLWYGHSIGRWEGDTLVVDTVGFSTDTTLAEGVWHSDKMHVVERIRLIGPDRLEIVTTIEDPEALVKPWVLTRHYARHRDWDIKEYICEQNNRDGADEKGRPSMRLD